jgi:hypothetical protein
LPWKGQNNARSVQLGLEVDIAEKALLPFEGPQGAAHPEGRRHRVQLSPPI